MVGTQQLLPSRRLSVIWIERRIPRLRRAVPSELEALRAIRSPILSIMYHSIRGRTIAVAAVIVTAHRPNGSPTQR